MSKKTKIWFIIATAMILIGSITFAGVTTMNKWDFANLTTKQFETNEYYITEDFRNISIDCSTASIQFIPTADNTCRIICNENKKEKHTVSVHNDTLTICATNNKAWYDYIGFSFHTPTLTVHLPQKAYTSLLIKGSTVKVEIPVDFHFESADISLSTGNIFCAASYSGTAAFKTTTGNIYLEGVSANEMKIAVLTGTIIAENLACSTDIDLRVTTGRAKLSDVTCRNITSNGNTGSIDLTNVIAQNKFSIERSTGNIYMDKCEAAEIYIKTSTGDVKGTLLTEKIFITSTSTGTVDIPKSTTGGKCEIRTSTGDIKITIQ